jgi:hypothetical protein
MRCCGSWRCQHFTRKPSDVTIGIQLAPCPSFIATIVDRDAFPLERLRYLLSLKGRCCAHGRDAVNNDEFPAFHETRCLDFAFEIFCGEVGPRRRQP